MSLTAKQIADLNGSMTAAQNMALGTLIGELVGSTYIASGSVMPTASPQTFDTGLTSVLFAVVSLSGSPLTTHSSSTITTGSVAGTVVLSSWKPTSTSVTTLVSASAAPWQSVAWIAVG